MEALADVLGLERLARLLAISASSLRRYAAGERPTPDDVAVRLHFLAKVVGDLLGAYNEVDMCRWFDRPRSLLGDRSPAEVLSGSWDPEGDGPAKVREVARSLVVPSAT